MVAVGYELALPTFEKNNKWGYINEKGVEIIPFIYDKITNVPGVWAILAKKGDITVFLNKDGSLINSFNDDVSPGFNEMILVTENNGNKKIINIDGTEIISSEKLYQYDATSITYSGLLVAKNNKWGLIDMHGVEVVPCIYEEIKEILDGSSEGILLVKKDSKYGYIRCNGEKITPFIYDNAIEYYKGFAKVCKNGKWGYINMQGNEITPCIYDDGYYFVNGIAGVKQNGKWGYINMR